ncbi:LysR family transcriptional regulator [Streptomyces sp. ME19-01-6]|uniref:LysR family transcriptional regulator n=1 Tax=Streptomyces sp. ME19-01-6 TaxID=3028686 RepID=UPI0029B30D76|nr:LysR family transcriptional regulator [Streptomyces sp. ME19-01-6]MDX3230124.1 LysR family transcriptional regulator [Streptomyces sp. ME19-01-6]
MDPHLLRTFVSVARRASFAEAARDLGFPQSAVSRHIATLEADLRTPLLTRRPVAPTAAGARLLEHAGPLLHRLDAARADVERLAGAATARLTLGASPLAMAPRVAAALAEVRRAHTGLRTAVRLLGRDEIPAAVAAGQLDLGLTDGLTAPGDPLPLPDPGPLPALAVAEGPLVVLLPLGHPLSRRLGLRLTDLAAPRWRWLDAPDAAVPLRLLRAASGTDGFRAALRYEGTDVRALLALAAAGHGLTLLPHSATAGAPGLVAVPLISPRLVHRVELLHGTALDDPAADFAELVTGMVAWAGAGGHRHE